MCVESFDMIFLLVAEGLLYRYHAWQQLGHIGLVVCVWYGVVWQQLYYTTRQAAWLLDWRQIGVHCSWQVLRTAMRLCCLSCTMVYTSSLINSQHDSVQADNSG